MISDAYGDNAVGLQRMSETVEEGRARSRLTFFCMASLLACAFSATSAIELGSSTRPFTDEKAGREAFGPITKGHDIQTVQAAALTRGECLRATCQAIAGPIVRIAAPPQNAPHSGPQSAPPPGIEPVAPVVAIHDTPGIQASADDDDVLPPLPADRYEQTSAHADMAPLPARARGSRLPRYIEVALPASTPWFALPSVELDAPATAPGARTTVALAPAPDSFQR